MSDMNVAYQSQMFQPDLDWVQTQLNHRNDAS